MIKFKVIWINLYCLHGKVSFSNIFIKVSKPLCSFPSSSLNIWYRHLIYIIKHVAAFTSVFSAAPTDLVLPCNTWYSNCSSHQVVKHDFSLLSLVKTHATSNKTKVILHIWKYKSHPCLYLIYPYCKLCLCVLSLTICHLLIWHQMQDLNHLALPF